MIRTIWSTTLKVTDLKKATAFYEKTLELDKKYEYSSYAGFQCGAVEIGLSPGKKDNKPIENAPTIELLVDNVDATVKKLKAKGVKFTKEPHDEPWGGRQASFLDPDGNLLEIVQIKWPKYFEISLQGSKP